MNNEEKQKQEEERIEREISSLNRTIDNWEDTDFIFLQPELRELRHRIMYVHTRLEASVGLLLWKWITEPGKGNVQRDIRVQMGSRFDAVVSETDFARKVSLAQELNLISGKMMSQLFAVNNLRLIFSHPKSHETEIRELLDRKEYLKALINLKAAYDGMNEIFTAFERAA